MDEVVEPFSGLSITGDIAGTRRIDAVVNDAAVGSAYVRVSGVNDQQPQPDGHRRWAESSLAGGVDPNIPGREDLTASAELIEKIEGPVTAQHLSATCRTPPRRARRTAKFVSCGVRPVVVPDRSDIFVDQRLRPAAVAERHLVGGVHATIHDGDLTEYAGNSFVASYGPWIKVPHPQHRRSGHRHRHRVVR